MPQVTSKPIVALLEPEVKKGGLTDIEIKERLTTAASPCKKHGVSFASMYEMWGLVVEVPSWGYYMPIANQLYNALFTNKPIEWNRIGAP